jgi:DNA (cytosine-5)-methyltransferase 1
MTAKKTKTNNDNALVAAVDLFCGVGGLTCGLQRAGIEVKLGVDIDPNCRFPFEANNKARFSQKSVAEVTPQEIKLAWGEAQYKLLAGCAPCQPFSTYSQAWDPTTDHRWALLLDFARLVCKTKPDFVTMENVPRLQRQGVFRDFVDSLERDGFRVSFSVVNCVDYGVPQFRRRLVLLASRLGTITLIPSRRRPTDRLSVRQAISGLPPLSAGEICHDDALHQSCTLSDLNYARIKASKPGGTWKDWPKRLLADCHTKTTGDGYVSVYGRMTWDDPAPTVTTQFYAFGSGRFGHPNQNRAISLREGAILQSFPKGYKFVPRGKPIHTKVVGRLIGNAVPVKLGEAIGRSVIAHIAERGDSS